MLEHWGFTLPAVLRRHRDGPLGTYVDAFAARLRDQGYVRCTARYQIQLISAFGRWLNRQEFNVRNLNERLIDHFIRSQRLGGRLRSGDRGILRALLKQLQDSGVIKVPWQLAVDGPFDPIKRAYENYLESERRLNARDLDARLIDHFIRSQRLGGRNRSGDRGVLRALLKQSQETGVVKVPRQTDDRDAIDLRAASSHS